MNSVKRVAAALFAGLLAVPLGATEKDGPKDIPPQEWRELASGKTLVYMIEGELFAYERYPLSGNQVELQLSTGECLFGTWSHTGTSYCFDWGAPNPACFRHVRLGESILIIQQDNGVDTDAVQQMVGSTDGPLLCGQQMS